MIQIGRSTDPSSAERRDDVAGSEPATFRYNNPGAQYPSERAARFGQIGYGLIGGGHKIARFPSPVNGAASNFDLLSRSYVGMKIGDAGTKWTGSHGFGIPGYDPNATLTKEMLDDPAQAIALLKAIANRESGKGNNLTEAQWRQAHDMFVAGSANAYLDGLPAEAEIELPPEAGPSGAGLLRRAPAHRRAIRELPGAEERSGLARPLGLRRVRVLAGLSGGEQALRMCRRQGAA